VVRDRPVVRGRDVYWGEAARPPAHRGRATRAPAPRALRPARSPLRTRSAWLNTARWS